MKNGINFKNHKDLSGVSNLFFSLKVFAWISLLTLGLFLIANESIYWTLLGYLLAAAMMAHGVELQHQALHNTGFSKKRLNHSVGFFLGLPLLISYSHYRDRHLHHHNYVGTEQDSEFFQFSKEGNDKVLRFVFNLFMIPHWFRVVKYVGMALVGKRFELYNSRFQTDCRIEYVLFALAIAALSVGMLVSDVFIISYMVLPLIASPIHTLLELPEHFGCERTDDIFKSTRTIYSGWFMTWFTNGNNFHVEHHLIASIIPERLRALHKRIEHLEAKKSPSYLHLISGALRGTPSSSN